MKTADLELIASCHWVENRLQVKGDNEIIQTVHAIKPRYTEDTIRCQLVQLRELEREFFVA
jgi:hypothetical protein